MPKVWNMRDPKRNKNAVYVGRPTLWGNPWSHLDVPGTIKVPTREEAVINYDKWIRSQPDKMETLRRDYRGLDLSCWCAPKLCHADVLIEIANGD